MRAVLLTHPVGDPAGVSSSQGKAQRLVCAAGNDFLLLVGNGPFMVTEHISLELVAFMERKE